MRTLLNQPFPFSPHISTSTEIRNKNPHSGQGVGEGGVEVPGGVGRGGGDVRAAQGNRVGSGSEEVFFQGLLAPVGLPESLRGPGGGAGGGGPADHPGGRRGGLQLHRRGQRRVRSGHRGRPGGVREDGPRLACRRVSGRGVLEAFSVVLCGGEREEGCTYAYTYVPMHMCVVSVVHVFFFPRFWNERISKRSMCSMPGGRGRCQVAPRPPTVALSCVLKSTVLLRRKRRGPK